MDEIGYIVLSLDEKYGSNSRKWKHGDFVEHPDGYMVRIVSGYYRDPTYDRISNFWYWNRVYKTGRITKKEYHGYGW